MVGTEKHGAFPYASVFLHAHRGEKTPADKVARSRARRLWATDIRYTAGKPQDWWSAVGNEVG